MQSTKKPPTIASTTEAQIAVHWKEEEYFKPSKVHRPGQSHRSRGQRALREKNFPECYEEYADMLTWYKRWKNVLDTNDPPFWKWFVGGKINASYNCVDRNLAKYKNKAAIILFRNPKRKSPCALTYQELYVRVNEFAALLRDFAGLEERATASRSTCP